MFKSRTCFQVGSLLFLTIICLLYIRNRQQIYARSQFGLSREQWSPQGLFPPASHGCPGVSNNSIPIDIDPCINFPTERLADIQITIKTGIGERDHLETLLNTYGSCISNALIVSDAPDRVANREVIDILADLPESYRNSTVWETYKSQLADLAAGRRLEKSSAGWALDKLKFLPMLDRAYSVAPKAKWYVFIETDIYYFWDTLFRTLDRLDPEDYHYLGAPAAGAHGLWFAYGGGGIVISGSLVRALVQNGRERMAIKHEELTRDDPCGDAILAYAIKNELGVRLGHLFPIFSGSEAFELKTNDIRWCSPLLGLHRSSKEQMQALWAWERCRAFSDRPLQYATFLDFSLTPILKHESSRKSWHNGADIGKPHNDIESAAACAEICAKDQDCLQYILKERTCYTSEYVQMGKAVNEEVTSGWDLTHLAKRGYSPDLESALACSVTKWVEPEIGNPSNL